MTSTVSIKYLVFGVMVGALAIPAFSHAATPATTALQSQYELLMQRFEAFKANRASSTGTSTRPIGGKASSTVNRTCMAAAVATREAAVKTAWTTFTTAITASLDERATALATAWNSSTEGSRSAIAAAWSEWRRDSAAAHTKLRSDRKTAWETFKTTAKESCKVTTPTEEGLERTKTDGIVL